MKRTAPHHKVTVSMGFMPAFFHKHLGLTYGEAYYFDPGYRAKVECAESRFLYEILGRFGMGSPNPSPWPNLFIQPIDLLKATQGAVVCCPPDATLETRGNVWADLSVEDISRLDPRAAAFHPFVDRVLDEYREMKRLFGDQADVFGIKSGVMNIHAPYTTAHQLLGEKVFFLLMDDPAGAQVVFDKVWEMYKAVFARITAEIGGPQPGRIYLGDCSAGMLSPENYRDVVLPANQAIASKFPQAGYHSCGASTHLLESFARLPGVTAFELGAGTDLGRAVSLLPGAGMRPLVDPLALRNQTPDEVAALTRSMAEACAPAPSTELCVWSLDRETPVANAEALYREVELLNQG